MVYNLSCFFLFSWLLYFFYYSMDEYPGCFHTEHTLLHTLTHTRSTADCNICIQRKSEQCFFSSSFLPILFHFHEEKGTIFCTLKKRKSYNKKMKKAAAAAISSTTTITQTQKRDEKNVPYMCEKNSQNSILIAM